MIKSNVLRPGTPEVFNPHRNVGAQGLVVLHFGDAFTAVVRTAACTEATASSRPGYPSYMGP
jgi:hypothetical protein